MAMERFEIRIADSEVADLQQRLGMTRLGSPPAGEPWESGVDYDYLSDLIDHWSARFDWRVQEARLNAYPQFRVQIADRAVHFVYQRADRESYPGAIPIILSHGWPYSFLEMLPILQRLADPLGHGGEREDAFDVVVPSLPGYGFSEPLAGTRFTGDAVARIWHSLMTETLGYRRYATYGEDVGAAVSDWLGVLFPEAILGLFATHAAFAPPDRRDNLSAAERRFLGRLDDKWRTGRGYSHIQATRPDTLAAALNDSPAGLLAWLVEKYREWTGPDFDRSWTVDDILTTASLYWLTQTIGTSFLAYYDNKHEPVLPMVSVPVGVSVQWGERGFPREHAERTYTDIRFWKELPRGGHFTAMQTPDLVAEDMRTFFRPLR